MKKYYCRYGRTKLRKWLQGGVIYDLGGYNGIYGLVAGLANKNAKVVICEADTANKEQINYNIKLNNLKNVRVVGGAVTGRTGEINFKKHSGGIAGSISDDSVSVDMVKCFSLSDLFLDKGMPALIKFDIVGAEYDALHNAHEILKKIPTLKILLEFYKHSPEQCNQFWVEREEEGFRTLFLYPRLDVATYYFLWKDFQQKIH